MILKKVLPLFILLLMFGLNQGSSILSGLRSTNITEWIPPQATDHPNGYWFGSQNLFCVLGMSRHKRAATRNTLAVKHRLIFYRGTFYEWGVGDKMFHIGKTPASRGCSIKWESEMAGENTCKPAILTEFTHFYKGTYGPYNMLTNNCHHYANRLSMLLSSSYCKAPPSDKWAQTARTVWRLLGSIRHGEMPDLRHLYDIKDETPSDDSPVID